MVANSYRYSILIVDDNPKNIQVAANILQNPEIQLGFAKSGEEAIQRIQEKRYDLLLMDVMMPGMDGFETVRHIKTLPDYKHVPVIFVTAKADNEDVIEGFYSGGVDYVTKPYREAELWARVNTHLTLKSYRDRLEERVQEETEKRLEQEKIIIQNAKMAAMGEMMGAIMHQWQQPLTVISMITDTLAYEYEREQGKISQETVDETCSMVKERVRFLSETYREFRNFFKPDRVKSTFDLATETESIIQIMMPKMSKMSIVPEMNIPTGTEVLGFKNEYKQVILNMINNACDAIAAQRDSALKGGRIVFACEEKEGHACVSVSDTGGGIPDEMMDSIFKMYATTKGDGGTGIGLALCKDIIEGHMNGQLTANNTDVGAEFRICLPLTSTKA